MNVHTHPAPKRSTSETGSAPVAGGGQPPYDEGMEKRIANLEAIAVKSEERFDRIESRLDRMEVRLEQTATKSDLTESESRLRSEMQKGFGDVYKNIADGEMRLRSDMQKGFTEGQKSTTDTIKWMMQTITVVASVSIAAITLIVGFFLPKAQITPPAQQPIVIQLPAPATSMPAAPLPATPQQQP